MGKHAYLIIAHKFDETFLSLIKLLDYYNNDIYVHMDLKVKDYDKDKVNNLIKFSRIFHIERSKVQWGAYSLINCELMLLTSAVNRFNYDYYHLISGQDLPLKKQKYIHSFFSKNIGKEFVGINTNSFFFNDRVKYYYVFQEKLGKRFRNISRGFALIQKPFIKRNGNIIFRKGSQWFSITDKFARFVLKHNDWIYNTFKNTYCCDEIFLQTILFNSEFINNLYCTDYKDDCNSNLRFIDWSRGNPYIFKNEDFDLLINSGALFARKFDCNIDKDVIIKIRDYILK